MRYQAAIIEQYLHCPRDRRDSDGLPRASGPDLPPVQVDSQGFPVLDPVGLALDQGQADVERAPVEYARGGLRYHRGHPSCLEGPRGLLPAGATTEVAARGEDVAPRAI